MSAPSALNPFRSLPLSARVSVGLLGGLLLALCWLLWPHWRTNADLSHGFFMPVIFLLLWREARAGTLRIGPMGLLTSPAAAGLMFAAILSFAAAGLYALSLGWSHDLVAFMFTFSLVLLLAGSLLVFSSSSVRWVPCNWSAVVAIALWLLCAPLPPGTYTRLTLGLQLMVTENVLRTLHLLGIAAVRHGNILELASASVDIEEACSGVRSLISCIFAGLFFSASLVRRPGARALIIFLSVPLALAMNFVRSLTLTLVANSGVSIAGPWHDLTGFGVLAITVALLAGLALLLERRASVQPSAARDQPGPVASGGAEMIRQVAGGRLLAGTLVLAWALGWFFYANTQPAPRRDAPVPNLAGILPAGIDGWHVETARDLYQFSDTLQTDHLVQRTYTRDTDQGPEQVTLYLAYWRPGQASVSLVASHTPDACWPGSGWETVPVGNSHARLTAGGRLLPNSESRSFQSGGYPQNVWFWHLYDGRPITQPNPNSPVELLGVALRYGFHHDGDQLFVRVSSNRSWSEIAHEPLLDTFFSRLQPLGL